MVVSPRLGLVAAGVFVLVGCSRTPRPGGDPDVAGGERGVASAPSFAPSPAIGSRGSRATLGATPPGAAPCAPSKGDGPACFRFTTSEDAFRWVLTKEPLVLAVGESHAPRGAENVASSTKRFTEMFLPLVARRSTDIVVELWAPDPKCMPEVKRVASAQKPITDVQATSNQDEYVTLGNAAKKAGVTPWLLRPTCDDFAMLADAGEDAISAMLGLVKRLTEARVTQLYERNTRASGGDRAIVVAYGGALHNDLTPPETTKEYSFGPSLDRLTGGRYVELDIIVPEFVKKTPTWEQLPWYASFEAERDVGRASGQTTLYVLGERSFVIVFPG